MNERRTYLDQRRFSRRLFLQSAAAAATGLALQAVRPGRRLSGFAGTAQAQEPLIVTDPAFGAKGDGVTNDRAAFQAAIDKAIQEKRPLRIPKPPAFYRIVLEPAHNQLKIQGDITIIGDGRSDTLLQFGIANPDPSKNYFGFFIHNDSNFNISDLRLEEDARPADFELQGFFFESGPEDNQCVIERVDVDGFTNIAISNASGVGDGKGELFLTIRDCDFKPYQQYCVAFWSVEEGHKRLHIYDSYFHDNTDSHLVYCHPHNSVYVENCRFDGATSWAFHFQGTAISGDPEYQRLVGCWFGSRNSRAIITHSGARTHPRPEIINCIFEASSGVQIRSDVLIDGCYFTNNRDTESTNPFITAIDSTPWEATIRNCVFAPKANVMPHIDFRLEGVKATIENCQFFHQGFGSMLNVGKGPTNESTVTNCLFYTRADNASQATFLEVDNGRTTVTNCRFMGRAPRDVGFIVCRNRGGGLAADASLRIDDCDFRNVSGGSIFYVIEGEGDSWRGRISGANNRFTNLLIERPLLGIEGNRAAFYALLAPIPGQSPVPISSGTSLVLSSNYDTYQVIGTADIANLHWWSEDGLSDPLFDGAVTLVGGTPFSLVTGGNIQLAGRSGRSDIAAGESARLVYSSEQRTWTLVIG